MDRHAYLKRQQARRISIARQTRDLWFISEDRSKTLTSPTSKCRKSSYLLFLGALAIASAVSLPAQAIQIRRPDVRTEKTASDTQSVAYRNGYQDGWIAGEEAWANSGAFRLKSNDQYSKGTHGYDESLGDKSEYKRLYKKGFEEGYSVGYGQSLPSRVHRD